MFKFNFIVTGFNCCGLIDSLTVGADSFDGVKVSVGRIVDEFEIICVRMI